MRSSPVPVAFLALAVGGCAENGFKGGDASFLDSASPTDADSGDTHTGEPPLVPVYQHFDASLHLVGGTPEVATSTLSVTLHTETGEVVCTQSLPLLAVRDESRPERALLGWWRFDTGPGEPGGACDPYPPSTLRLGLEPYDPQLDPFLLAAGFEDATAASAVVQTEGTRPLWLGGIFGTGAQLAGYAPAPAVRPIADGDWSWVGLVLLPL